MNIFIWLWNIFWLLFTIGWWLNGLRVVRHATPSIWLMALIMFAVPHAYRYWCDRRDAADVHPDMRGKQPGPSDE